MTPEQSELVYLSQLLLVASDQSYGGKTLEPIPGQLPRMLDIHPDGPAGTDFRPPYSVSDSGFEIVTTFEEQSSGFKAVIYRKNGVSKEIVVAFAGTDGRNAKDWWSSITQYGWNQWSRNRVPAF